MNQIQYLVFETIKVLEYMHDIAQRKKEYKAIFQYNNGVSEKKYTVFD